MMKGTIRGQFSERLARRLSALAGVRAAARIEVPPELSFWYWDEFGTATRGDPGRASGHSYGIDPVSADALRFPQGGAIVFRDHVDHPGITPKRSVTKVLPEIQQNTASLVREAFRDGAADDPSLLQRAVKEATDTAKALIAESMSANLPGTRELEPELGRLGGATAAEVFEEKATVIELNEA